MGAGDDRIETAVGHLAQVEHQLDGAGRQYALAGMR
jgi:hypothetical protein